MSKKSTHAHKTELLNKALKNTDEADRIVEAIKADHPEAAPRMRKGPSPKSIELAKRNNRARGRAAGA